MTFVAYQSFERKVVPGRNSVPDDEEPNDVTIARAIVPGMVKRTVDTQTR